MKIISSSFGGQKGFSALTVSMQALNFFSVNFSNLQDLFVKKHQAIRDFHGMAYNDSFEFVPCDICGRTGAPNYIHMADHLNGMPGTFTIAKCRSCGLLFTNPRPTQNAIDSLYSNYYNESVTLSEPQNPSFPQRMKRNPSLRKTYHLVFGNYLGEFLSKARGRVLDIGCGLGETLEDLTELGCECSGIEPNSAAAKICRGKGLDVKCGLADELTYAENSFDTTILIHVIEHLPSPKKTLQKIFQILRPGGRVFVVCPNAESYMARFFKDYWAGWHLPFHFYHFTPQTIAKLIGLTNFEIVKLKACTSDLVLHRSVMAFLTAKRKDAKYGKYLPLMRSFYFRLLTMLLFRPLDALRPGKGEFLQVELRKPAKSL